MNRESASALHELVRYLSNAVGAAQLYSVEHPQVSAYIPRAVDAVRQFVGDEEEKTLVFLKGVVFYQGKPLERDPHLDRVARICDQIGVGYIRLNSRVTAAEMRQLVRLLVGSESRESMRASAINIRIGEVDAPEDGEIDRTTREIAAFEQLSHDELKQLGELYRAVSSQEAFNLKDLASVIAGFIAAFRREANPLLALVPLRQMDEYTFTHSINVGILNISQGISLGIEGQLLHDIGIAGMLHDVGKLYTAESILKKTDVLTTAEWQVMRKHPSLGAQYLLNQPDIPRVAVIAAFEHHMRHDLHGYPRMKDGWEINLCSEMTMISDTFDALRTRRVYKDAWDFPKAAGHLLSLSGGQLHPDLTMNFLKMLAQMGERAGVLSGRGETT
jgi:HD-GYP domain-containing protein (c-di-GMP phosphodiesterase class II)